MYLMGVEPWESAKWVVPSLEEMSGEMRQKLEAANTELAIKTDSEGVVSNGASAEEKDSDDVRRSEGATNGSGESPRTKSD